MRNLKNIKTIMLLLIVLLILLPAKVTFAADNNSSGNGREASYQKAATDFSFGNAAESYVKNEWGWVENNSINISPGTIGAIGDGITNIGQAIRSNAQRRFLQNTNQAAKELCLGEKTVGGWIKQAGNKVSTASDMYGAYLDFKYLTSGQDAYNSETLETLYDGFLGYDNTITVYEKKYPQYGAVLKPLKKVNGAVRKLVTNEEFQRQVNNCGWLNNGLKGSDMEFRSFQGSTVYAFNRLLGMNDEMAKQAMDDYMEQRTYRRENQLNGNNMTDEQKRRYAQAEVNRRKAMHEKTKQNIKQSRKAKCYKPNIYLYPEETTEITVTFKYPGMLATVIPDYSGEWKVVAEPNGKLTTADGSVYDYLFYESATNRFLFQYDEGFVVDANSRKACFENILAAYGLNVQEIADFTDYWCAKLPEGIDYVMYPQLTKTVDDAMPIEISGNPDTIFRIWFVFERAADQQVRIPEIKKLERNGFVAIEWGGVFWE